MKENDTLRILHTSDWHLGMHLEQASRSEEHSLFLDWLLLEIQSRKVDVLIVAGDVFHHSQPSARALRMYYEFLKRCANATELCQVVIVGGNHDSATRLDAPFEILNVLDVHVVGGVNADDSTWNRCICPIFDEERQARAVVVAVPYIQEARLNILTTGKTSTQISENYREEFSRLYQVLADRAQVRFPGVPLIATGHLTCSERGSKPSKDDYQSEIHQVGTIGALPPSIFDPRYCYVALGHIHNSRRIGQSNAWYSGTPVAAKVEEAFSARKVLIVEIEAGEARVTPVEVPIYRDIFALRGTEAEITEAIIDLKSSAPLPPLLTIEVLLDKARILEGNVFEDLLDRHFEPEQRPRVVTLRQRLNTGGRLDEDVEPSLRTSLRDMTPEHVFRQLFMLRHENQEPDEEILVAFRSLLSELNVDPEDEAQEARVEATPRVAEEVE